MSQGRAQSLAGVMGCVCGGGGGGGGEGGGAVHPHHVIGASTPTCTMSQQAGKGPGWWGERHRGVSRPTCSMRSTCRVMLAARPKSISLSKDGSLVMELTLTMLLRRALARVKPSKPAGLLGKSKLAPPLLLLAGGGILFGLPCTIKVCP